MNTMKTQPTPGHSGRAKIVSPVLALLAGLMVVAGLSSCSTPSTQDASANANAPQMTASNKEGMKAPPPKKADGAPPKALEDAGEYGENVYDMVKADDWSSAAAKLKLLGETATKLKSVVRDWGGELDRLASGVTALDRAVTSRDRRAAMREANLITLIVANLNAPYKLAVPVEVTKLDYYGRELEIWSAEKDTRRLQETAAEIRRTWDAVRPAIESHKGAAESKRFDDLVAKVELAKTPEEYARLATPVLDEVDNLEKVFHG